MATRIQTPSLRGRSVVITGGTSGLGRECARAWAAVGGSVVLAVRDPDRGERVAAKIGGDVAVARLDLADLRSVRAFAADWAGRPIDVLLNNAGIMMAPAGRTADGFERHLGVNHLGHFALTGLLLPYVRDRVVTVSSQAHRQGTLVLDDLHGEHRRYHAFSAYAASKLANLLFVLALSRRLPPGVRSIGAHPGWAATNLVASAPGLAGRAMRLGTRALARGVAVAAEPLLLATTHDLPNGSYVGPTGLNEFWGAPGLVGRSASAGDSKLADALWAASVAATGVDPGLPEARLATAHPRHLGRLTRVSRVTDGVTRPGLGLDRVVPCAADGRTYPTRFDKEISMGTSTPALEVAEKYHNAWTTGDLEGAIGYVADDVAVHAPGAEITGKDAYREYLGGFMQMLTGLTNLAAFGDDDSAVLYYFPHTPFTQTAPAAEFFTVTDGKISESHLVFDRMSFGPPPEQG